MAETRPHQSDPLSEWIKTHLPFRAAQAPRPAHSDPLTERLMPLQRGFENFFTGLGATMGGGGDDPARVAIEKAMAADTTLTEPQRQAIRAWMGGAPLADGALGQWVTRVTGGLTPQNAPPLPGTATATATAPGLATNAPGAPGLGAGANGAPGLGAAGGLPPGDYGTPPGAAALKAAPDNPALPPNAGPINTSDMSSVALLADPERRSNFALQSAGMDPYKAGLAQQFFSNFADPQLTALSNLYGYLPNQIGKGAVDPAQVAGDFGNYAKSFVTPGQSGFGMSRDMAQQILANPAYFDQLRGVGDASQIPQLESMMNLANPLNAPLRQAYLKQQNDKLQQMYKDRAYGTAPGSTFGQYGGDFTAFLDQDPEAARIARDIYGYVPRTR